MNVYENKNLFDTLKNNDYPGRGLVIGCTDDKKYAVAAYFIMGRSENSRNRVFVAENENVTIYPFDESKVEDPSLIIYSPLKVYKNRLIVTNGDQTDTVCDGLKKGVSFSESLKTREFEPDCPNFTPRISGILNFNNGYFDYEMSILKSSDSLGTACDRYLFSYSPVKGTGHFISTYNCNGNPIPSFTGEPLRVGISGNISSFTENLWDSLNKDNKVSLLVRYIKLSDMSYETKIINKNSR